MHDQRPRRARKQRPGRGGDGRARLGRRHHGQPDAGLHGQPRQRQHHAREDVDDDLLVDAGDFARARRPAPEDDVPAEEAGEEAVVGAWMGGEDVSFGVWEGIVGGVLAFFAWCRDVVLEEQAGEFVDGGEPGQVAGVHACRAEDELCFFAEAGRDGGDGAITRAFDDGEQGVVFRVEDDTLGDSLGFARGQNVFLDSLWPNRTLRLSRAAADMVPRQFGDAGGQAGLDCAAFETGDIGDAMINGDLYPDKTPAAEKYDGTHLLWVHEIEWPEQAIYAHSKDDHVHTLQGLNFLWRLGAVGLLEYKVRRLIHEITEPQLNALLAVTDDPGIVLPISLRKLLLVVVNGREEAIRSALELFYPILEDPDNNMGDVPVWDLADVAAIEKRIGSHTECAELDCSPSNGTMATYRVSRRYKGSVMIPTKTKRVYVHIHTSVKDLCVIERVLDYRYRPDRIESQKYVDRCEVNRREVNRREFWDFEAKLHRRWTHVEETWDPPGYYVQRRRWELRFELGFKGFQDWASLDLNLSDRWMDRGSVLDSELLE
ncbi:hypothetical protein CHGG_05867 [Chaetomium globosum CBS 148.51]|uniref:Uncharacterized protein n=1 Tax=Chaetomium globosum (strain ATCC 6205 / CBS 148.51 / DSM 1962 / NBRC 6347 / NRRL 1970) TaxID=306901 RepID=Q2H648_CHAGB|nr:uncharacterized protein CHGG_05867 [Chaetomium globosum CBS 148.51]EAQ89248.1 hypothetical protein CHGG_05867 [Chaetomium globosum CBS 148.51]